MGPGSRAHAANRHITIVMLQNRQDKRNTRNIQLPRQVSAPNFRQIEYLFDQCGMPANFGRAFELPFGTELTYGWMLTVMRLSAKQEAQWMFYRLSQDGSALEWSQATDDINMIANAICAQFPEVDLSVKDDAHGLNAPPILLQKDDD